MLKGFGLVFLSLLLACTVSVISGLMNSNFPINYAKNNSIEILATLFALNIASASFLIGSLLNIEEKVKKDVFTSARKEIKDNLYVMTGLFGLNIFLVALINDKSTELLRTGIKVDYIFATIVVAVLIAYIYLLMEIISAVFHIRVPKD